MSIPTHTILEELTKITAMKKMKVCAQQSVKYGMLVGTVTAISGVIAGPLGLAAGGIISSSIAAILSNGKFNSIPHILLYETTEEDKEKLGQIIRETLHSHHIYTTVEYISALRNNPNLEMMLIRLVISFVTSELGMMVQT